MNYDEYLDYMLEKEELDKIYEQYPELYDVYYDR